MLLRPFAQSVSGEGLSLAKPRCKPFTTLRLRAGLREESVLTKRCATHTKLAALSPLECVLTYFPLLSSLKSVLTKIPGVYTPDAFAVVACSTGTPPSLFLPKVRTAHFRPSFLIKELRTLYFTLLLLEKRQLFCFLLSAHSLCENNGGGGPSLLGGCARRRVVRS